MSDLINIFISLVASVTIRNLTGIQNDVINIYIEIYFS